MPPVQHFLRLLRSLPIALALTSPGFAQLVRDDFRGGFSPELDWTGDLQAFAGEDGRLVLRDTRPTPSNAARVSFPAVTRDSACWSLDVRQGFNPSAANRLRYWLAADAPLISGEAVGYYVQVGGVSGDGDAFSLFYDDASTATLVAAGAPGVAAADPLAASLRVCANADRQWGLAVRGEAGALLDTASGTGPVPLRGAHVGFDVRFTPTRNGLLSLDNLSVAPVRADTKAPHLVLAEAADANAIRLFASEGLQAASLSAGNYAVDGRPVAGVVASGDTIILSLSSPLVDGVPALISIGNWIDLAGNASGPLQASVLYVAPRLLDRYELLITEIMADPTPAIGLPQTEYVELYNAGDRAIDLGAVTIVSPRTDARLPAITLSPGAYVALAAEETSDERFVTFPTLPTLTNAGTTLRLRSGERVVDAVTYDPALYPPGLRDGGYSLERVDLALPCARSVDNFRPSRSIAGGTPGAANTVAETTAAPPLTLTEVQLRGEDSLSVGVSRALTSEPSAAFLIDGRRVAGAATGEDFATYLVSLARALVPGDIRTLTLASNARSCAPSEVVSDGGLIIGIPEEAEPGDWAVNEIMYDPLAGQGRWLELANVSDKLLSPDGLLLAEADATGTVVAPFAVAPGTLVSAGGYLTVADDPTSLLMQYPDADRTAVTGADVPTLGREACLTLLDPVAEIRHFLVCYSEDWHNRAYAKTDGVSLERIDLAVSGEAVANWTSAASTLGFATPTRRNSQARDAARATDVALALQRERLSPDGDGFEDLLAVDYAFPAPETLVTFEVVDLQGHTIYRPPEQEAVQAVGTWTWDGVTDEGTVADFGTYVLRVEWWREGAVAQRTYLPFSVVGWR